MTVPVVAKVLLESSLPQLDHLFEYAVPATLREQISVGQLVKVPLRGGTQATTGYIVSLEKEAEFKGNLSEISSLLSALPLLTGEVYRLARTLADRSAGSASDILRLAIPPRQVRVEKAFVAEHPNQALHPSRLSLEQSQQVDGDKPRRVALLVTNTVQRLKSGEWTTGWTCDLAAEAEATLREGKSVIIAVPDYIDLDRMQHALEDAGLGDHTIRLDAQQTNRERFTNFLQCLLPMPRIVIGNRAALYAPAHQLGKVIVWDAQDASMSEPRSPYVGAHDIALVRSELESCDLVLAANTLSLANYRLQRLGYLEVLEGKRSSLDRVAPALAVHSDPHVARIPASAIALTRNAIQAGPVLFQVFGKGSPDEQTLKSLSPEGTAESLKKLFSSIDVIISDGDNRRVVISNKPSIVVATRGAEPLAAGGYAAIIILDSRYELSVESLFAEEDALHSWGNAMALGQPETTVMIADGYGPLVQGLITGNLETWRAKTLDERAKLLYPPAARIASVTGPRISVEHALSALEAIQSLKVVPPQPVDENTVQAEIRFPYTAGAEVARNLRAALVMDAAVARKTAGQRNVKTSTRLRLHLDDLAILDSRPRHRS